MPKKSILISGAGIAGTTLAYWLMRRGFEPVLVERSPTFRRGGYILDFWGIGYDVAERMDIVPFLREVGYANDRMAFVRKDGRVRSVFGGAAWRRALGDRYISIQRGDLAHEIYGTICNEVETIFGDEVALIEQSSDSVEVCFKRGNVRVFDQVIGADGLHSRVRQSILDPTEVLERDLGYYVAAFVTNGYPRRDAHTYLSYAAPGRQISRFALRNDQTGFLFVLTNKEGNIRFPREQAAQKRLLKNIFSDDPWVEWPDIKHHLDNCSELYFDLASQVELAAWSKGRVALVGDAAYCPSLIAGEGSAFAMAGAYILAGEIWRANGNCAQAFGAYEQKFRAFIERKQKSARVFASYFAPQTALGLAARDIVLCAAGIPMIADRLMERFVADKYTLPDYEL